MGSDRVVVNHKAPGIPPVLVEGGCDGGGFVELLAPGALAPHDSTILFGAAWLDDLPGAVAEAHAMVSLDEMDVIENTPAHNQIP